MSRPTYNGWLLSITPRSVFVPSARGYTGIASKLPTKLNDSAAPRQKQARIGPITARTAKAKLKALIDGREEAE